MNSAPGASARYSDLPQLLQQALTAHRAGRLDAAYPLYRRILQQNPQHPAALQLLGVLHSQRGEYEPAIALMRESLRLFPEQPEVANNLGNALSRCGRLEEAIESYARAIELHPRYVDALRNLGLANLQANRLDEAARSLQQCLQIAPDDAVAWLSLGNLHKRRNEFDAAIQCYEKALALRPDYAEAHHNLGVCLRMAQRPRQALEHYEAARRLGLDRAELYHNIANARADAHEIGGAIDAYRAALQRNPRDLDGHRNLNSLLWQHELLDDYLQSYREALNKYPAEVHLRLAYAMALNQQGAFAEAEQVLAQGLRRAPESSELKSLLAYTLEGQGRWPDALQWHAAAVKTPGSIANHRISYARALLACQRPEEALREAQLGAVQIPFDQRALAYLGLCWRLLGDERDRILNDYEGLVRVYDVPVPREYANAEEFNRALAAVLAPLHVGKRHPAEQTVRGGTQTQDDLFRRREPEIAALVAGLQECLQDYVARFPRNREHPLFVRRTEGFRFAGSWSVRLQRCGYHTMHVHPLGWISSAYYVELPSEVTRPDAQGGAIKFGEPDIDLGANGRARRVIQPAVGRLVLFPSYMWHGTIPFESDQARMTVAFDVVPRQ